VTASGPYILDTNIVVHVLRDDDVVAMIERAVDLEGQRNFTSVVVVGECLALAKRRGWGARKEEALQALLAQLVVVDINRAEILERYAAIDAATQSAGNKMGKNDLWIAATAAALEATVVTADGDFDNAGELGLIKIVNVRSANAKV
jgi:tRNA(fMet)-specific endonuclease VapC